MKRKRATMPLGEIAFVMILASKSDTDLALQDAIVVAAGRSEHSADYALMRILKLHTKTTLLASAIILLVFFTALFLISIRVATRTRHEQKEIAELLADNLANHISNMPSPRDPETLARMATLLRGSRPGTISIRIWERLGGIFVERAAAEGSTPATDIPEETKEALSEAQQDILRRRVQEATEELQSRNKQLRETNLERVMASTRKRTKGAQPKLETQQIHGV